MNKHLIEIGLQASSPTPVYATHTVRLDPVRLSDIKKFLAYHEGWTAAYEESGGHHRGLRMGVVAETQNGRFLHLIVHGFAHTADAARSNFTLSDSAVHTASDLADLVRFGMTHESRSWFDLEHDLPAVPRPLNAQPWDSIFTHFGERNSDFGRNYHDPSRIRVNKHSDGQRLQKPFIRNMVEAIHVVHTPNWRLYARRLTELDVTEEQVPEDVAHPQNQYALCVHLQDERWIALYTEYDWCNIEQMRVNCFASLDQQEAIDFLRTSRMRDVLQL